MMAEAAVRYAADDDGVAHMIWGTPGLDVNVLNDASLDAFISAINRFVEDGAARGLIISSAKRTFMAGGDLKMLYRKCAAAGRGEAPWETPRAIAGQLRPLLDALRRLETCGKPVAAAINGSALGGGLEICLAAHHRIVVADDETIRLGFPEATLGLLPNAGGTQRLPRLIGIERAIDIMVFGAVLTPSEAEACGLIDRVVPADKLMEAAKTFVKTAENAAQPWDRRGFRIPGGGVQGGARWPFIFANARAGSVYRGNDPAPTAILACIYEGTLTSFEKGCRIESAQFARLARHATSRNRVRSAFLSPRELRKRHKAPDQAVRRIGVVGAGQMGSGIALAAALAGLEVVVSDTSHDAARAGHDRAAAAYDSLVRAGLAQARDKDEVLRRIAATDSLDSLGETELVIEAVFEDETVKRGVLGAVDALLPAQAIICTNTSTLAITPLGESLRHKGRFVGLHFLSPVPRMELVEIAPGQETDPQTVSRAFGFARQIRKLPVVLNADRGFITSRISSAYLQEGLHMLNEGAHPAVIENAGRAIGMPMGPLAVCDLVGHDASLNALRQTPPADAEAAADHADIVDMLTALVQVHRLGRKSGGGFYDYGAAGRSRRLWPQLGELFTHGKAAEDAAYFETLKHRLLDAQIHAALGCLDSGVTNDPRAVDVSALLGCGFPCWTGGPLSHVDTIGAETLIRRQEGYNERTARRFATCGLLRRLAEDGRDIYDIDKEDR